MCFCLNMSLHNRSSTCYLSVILRSLSIKVLSLVLDKHIGIQHVLASVLAACTRFVKYFCNIAILISKNVWKCFHATLHNLNRCSSLFLASLLQICRVKRLSWNSFIFSRNSKSVSVLSCTFFNTKPLKIWILCESEKFG